MTEVERIQDQFRRARQGQAWHGPSLYELLDEVTPAQAAAHPIPNAHSIWELANHIITWESIVLRRLSGERTGEVDEEVNFPPVKEVSETAWQATRARLQQSEKAVLSKIGTLRPYQLDDTVPRKFWTIYFELHGLVQHSLYHCGQIALLIKAQQQS
jgi:uncharacterized damage-inducible protein DinB